MENTVKIVNPFGRTEIVSTVAFIGGAYAGWTLAEGQHWAVKGLAALVGGCGASSLSVAVLG